MTTKSQKIAAIINAFPFQPGHVLVVLAGDRHAAFRLNVTQTGVSKRRDMIVTRQQLRELRAQLLAVGATVATVKKGILMADGFAKHDYQRAAFVKLSAAEAEREAEREAEALAVEVTLAEEKREREELEKLAKAEREAEREAEALAVEVTLAEEKREREELAQVLAKTVELHDAPDFGRLTKAQLSTMILRQKDMIDALKQKLTRTEDTCREVCYELRDVRAERDEAARKYSAAVKAAAEHEAARIELAELRPELAEARGRVEMHKADVNKAYLRIESLIEEKNVYKSLIDQVRDNVSVVGLKTASTDQLLAELKARTSA